MGHAYAGVKDVTWNRMQNIEDHPKWMGPDRIRSVDQFCCIFRKETKQAGILLGVLGVEVFIRIIIEQSLEYQKHSYGELLRVDKFCVLTITLCAYFL